MSREEGQLVDVQIDPKLTGYVTPSNVTSQIALWYFLYGIQKIPEGNPNELLLMFPSTN